MKDSFFAATTYVIFNQKVLLIKHPKIGKWLPVGGKVEVGESPDDAVKREVLEEVGLEVENILSRRTDSKKIDSFQYVQNEDLGSKYHIDFIYYSKPKTDEIKLDNEIKEAKWFDYQTYLSIKDDLFNDVKDELDKIYLEYLKYDPYVLIDKNKINELRSEKPVFVVVNHTDRKTLTFIKFLKDSFNTDILFLTKNYSVDKSAEKEIKKYVYNFSISTVSEVKHQLNTIFLSRKIIVFDLSAIFYNEIDDIKNKERIFIIEDTKNGVIYSEPNKATRFSIANSLLKRQIENPAVARTIFTAALKYFRTRNIQINQYSKILVLGIGSIGINLLSLFSKISQNTYGYDKDYSRLLLASIFNLKTTNTLEDISSFDYIFGVTGDKVALSEKHLNLLKENVYLINCSTYKFEFDTSFFNNKKIRLEDNLEIIEIREGEFIYRVNEGYPINFYDNVGTEEPVINTVFAYMIDFISSIFGSNKTFENKTYEVDNIDFSISKKYIEYYYRRFLR